MKTLISIFALSTLASCSSQQWDRKTWYEGLAHGYSGGCIAAITKLIHDEVITNNDNYLVSSYDYCELLYYNKKAEESMQ